MNITKTEMNGHIIIIARADSIVLSDEQSALEFIMSLSCETGSNRIAQNTKDGISEEFFNLSTKLAGVSFKNSLTTKLNLQSSGIFRLILVNHLKISFMCVIRATIYFLFHQNKMQ